MGPRARHSRSRELHTGKGPREGKDGLRRRQRVEPSGTQTASTSPPSKAEHTKPPPALTDNPRNTHGVTQMNLVFRYGAAPAEEQPGQQPPKEEPTLCPHPPGTPLQSWSLPVAQGSTESQQLPESVASECSWLSERQYFPNASSLGMSGYRYTRGDTRMLVASMIL